MDYGRYWGCYRIRLQPGDIEKHRGILEEIVADAFSAIADK